MRAEQHQLARTLRDQGDTWVDIAGRIRERWPELNARTAMRIAHGWTQKQAADKWNDLGLEPSRTVDDISAMERRRPGFAALDKLARLYECATTDLLVGDVADYRYMDAVNTPRMPVDVHVVSKEDDVNRRQFTAGAVVTTALGVSGSLQWIFQSASVASPTPEDVSRMKAAISALADRDALLGGGALCDLATTMHHRTATWLRATSDARLAKELDILRFELARWVGWLAHDAGRLTQANRYLTEAISAARLGGHPETEATNSMCLLLQETGRHMEALQCAELANSQGGSEPPRVRAVLALRLARSHAYVGNRTEAMRWIGNAEDVLETRPDDPAWARFATLSELASNRGGILTCFENHKEAADAYRVAVEVPDHHRNIVSRRVHLAAATFRQGDVGHASEMALDVLPLVTGLQSARITRRLADLHTAVTPYAATVPAARDFSDASVEAGLA